MNEKFTLTGGARIGSSNATYPFADLYVDKEILKLNASIIGNLIFEAKDIISIVDMQTKSGDLVKRHFYNYIGY